MNVGKLVDWKVDRAFGFLAFKGGIRERIFVHRSAFEKAGLEPFVGETYRFKAGDHQGRPVAVCVEVADG